MTQHADGTITCDTCDMRISDSVFECVVLSLATAEGKPLVLHVGLRCGDGSALVSMLRARQDSDPFTLYDPAPLMTNHPDTVSISATVGKTTT